MAINGISTFWISDSSFHYYLAEKIFYISQIMEELESLEETLNESIQESIGARCGKVIRNKKAGNYEEEDDILR